MDQFSVPKTTFTTKGNKNAVVTYVYLKDYDGRYILLMPYHGMGILLGAFPYYQHERIYTTPNHEPEDFLS